MLAAAPRRAIEAARSHLDLVLIAALLLGVNLLPHGDPSGIKGLGVIHGCSVALQAMAVVLVLRSSRIINFAQVQIGLLAGVVFFEMVRHAQVVLLVRSVCGPCAPRLVGDPGFLQGHPDAVTAQLHALHASGWLAVNFWVSLVFALALAPLLSWAVYHLVISRFDNAPRLVATVATIGVAEVVVGVVAALSTWVFQDQGTTAAGGIVPLPFGDVSVHLPGDSTVFHLGEVLMVSITALVCVALAVWFRRARSGVAIRASAEMPQRAQTLGIPVRTMTGRVWALAGLLGGLAAVLMAIAEGGSAGGGASFNVAETVPILAAVVFARMSSLWLAAAAALVLGVLIKAFFWNLNNDIPFEGILLVLIVASLALQRGRLSRAEEEATAGYLGAREVRPTPPALQRLPVVVLYRRWLLGGIAALVLGLPWFLEPGQVSLMSTVAIEAMVGLSLLVLTGWSGQISLGQFALAAVGAYVAALVSGDLGLPIVFCVLLGGLAGAAAAALVGVASLRLRGMHLAVTTVAFAVAAGDILVNPAFLASALPSGLDRPVFLGLDLGDEKTFLYFCLVWLALAAVAMVGLRRSRTGRALIALRDNENAGLSFGLSLLRVRLAAFCISGFLAALAGALFAYHQHGVNQIDYLPQASVAIFLFVVIGGLGGVAGPLLGAAYAGVLLIFPNPIWALLGSGIGVLAVLLMAPGGLVALAYRVRDVALRRVAVRNRVSVPELGVEITARSGRRAPLLPKTQRGAPVDLPPRYRMPNLWAALRPPADV
jgi:branched-chain amino acid transport system permease protein